MPLGIYHDPELWFGSLANVANQADVHYDEIIAATDLQTLQIAVSRDGMFVLDFSKWEKYANEPDKRRVNQIEIINTYLLCFYCAVATRGLWIGDYRRRIPMMRADSSNVLGVMGDAKQGVSSAGLSGDFLRMLDRRSELRKGRERLVAWPLPQLVIDISFDLFSVLWRNQDEKLFTFADLLLGAHVAHWNWRFAEAIAFAWLVIETLVAKQWDEYVDRNRQREGQTFITKSRRNRLKEGREYTASVRIEILSLLDEIPYELYNRLNDARKARNAWVHGLGPATIEDSTNAIQLAETLYRNRYGFNTTLPLASPTLIGGGEFVDPAQSSSSPSTREYVHQKSPIHVSGLDAELRSVLRDRTFGISQNGELVRVILRADSPAEDDSLASGVIEAHDPAFLSIDEHHRLLPGEHKFDSARNRPHVVGDGKDEAIITVWLPHTKESEVVVLLNNQELNGPLVNGKGMLKVVSNDPSSTILKLSVKDHPCDPLEIEVIAP